MNRYQVWLQTVSLAVVLTMSVILSCKSVNESNTLVKSETPVGTAAAGDQCASLCSDTKSEAGWAVCYSCRCKAAFDGYLPKAADLTCAQAQEIEVYSLSPSTGGLTKVEQQTSECLNPPRLPDARKFGGGCNPGSRLGQLDRGNLHFKWICRREVYAANFSDPQLKFDDFGIIGHNDSNGATCFWDDRDHMVDMTSTPDIDLTDRDPTKIKEFTRVFYRQEGERTCMGCHDNDPFMFSPYLTSINWKSREETTKGPYYRVQSDGGKGFIGKSLISDAASPCTECHRIGAKHTCDVFAKDSTGNNKIESFQASVRSSHMYGVLPTPSGKKAYMGYWMPQSSAFPATEADWAKKFGAARDHIATCCNKPDAEGCEWEDIPMSAEDAPANPPADDATAPGGATVPASSESSPGG